MLIGGTVDRKENGANETFLFDCISIVDTKYLAETHPLLKVGLCHIFIFFFLYGSVFNNRCSAEIIHVYGSGTIVQYR